jgi:hypothetical protein
VSKEKLAGGEDINPADMAAILAEVQALRRRNTVLTANFEDERKKRIQAEAKFKTPWRTCNFVDKI